MHYQIFKGRRHSGGVRNACRKTLLGAVALLINITAFGQSYPNGLSADSVHPSIDSVFIKEMRVKMDEIRRTQHRPTVALVLSGGGAKGVAHIGVKKVLDQMEIPVDMICGTSMGSLMGGLMSLGYSTAFLDSLLTHQDWGVTLTDKVDAQYIPYETKQYKAKYLLSVPFHYEQDVHRRGRRRVRHQPELNLNALDSRGDRRSFASSLPAGYVYGFNVNNVLSSLAVGYEDSIAFRDLPIPFFCVAADMVSCKPKNFGSGSLKTAMRSSMSIPGLFDPVRLDGMVLTDGGTRNNFPVDLAQAMGADYIIGVELSNRKPDYSGVNNIGNIVSQFITMLGKDAYDKNIDACDVFIKPDLEGFGMLSFSPEAVDTMIARGYEAAVAKREELQIVKDKLGDDAVPYLNSRHATDIRSTPVQISSVEFQGVTDPESRLLIDKIGLMAGQKVSKETMDEAMSVIQASGAFETVTYALLGTDEPYRLVFDCVKGPVHRLGLGLRVDTEEWASLAFNLGLNTQKLQGSTLDIRARIGRNQMANVKYSLDFPSWPTVNFEANIRNVDASAYVNSFKSTEDKITSNLQFLSHTESLYLSNIKWTQFDLQGGIRNTYCYSSGHWLYEDKTAQRFSSDVFGDHLSIFSKGTIYSMDREYYPTKGIYLNLGYELDFAAPGNKSFDPYHTLNLDYKHVIPLGKKFALIPEVHGRALWDTQPDDQEEWSSDDAVTYYKYNLIGGDMAGRYKPHQIPFIGFNGTYMAKNKLLTGGLELRYNPVGALFVSAKGAVFKEGDHLENFFNASNTMYWGAALEVGYNSILGPLRFNLHWSDFTHEIQAYVSIGFDF